MNKVNFIVKNSIILALYVVLTVFVPSFTFGPLQIRVSEILMYLILIDDFYIYGLVLGVAIANIFSPLGIVDVIFGTLATTIFLLTIILIKNKKNNRFGIFMIIFGTLYNAVTVSLLYYFVLSYPFFISLLEITISELCIMIIGYFVYKYLLKNKRLIEIIKIKKYGK